MTDTFHALEDRLQRARTAAGALRQQLARLPDRHSLQTPPLERSRSLALPGAASARPQSAATSALPPSPLAFKRASLLGARFLTLYAHVEVAAPLGFEPRPPSSKPVPYQLGEGAMRLVPRAGIEPAPPDLKDRCPRPLDERGDVGAGSENRTRVFCLEGSGSALELRPHGGWCRDRTCATLRSRRASNALPYRSANHPELAPSE